MLGVNIPDGRAGARVAVLLRAAERYAAAGWRIFIVRPDKRTLPGCDACREAGPGHDREACGGSRGHETCHGFYAATRDAAVLSRVLDVWPEGLLALRTGRASGVVVLDFESRPDGEGGESGLDVLDAWESWTGGAVELPPTLRARTASGGLHLLYRVPDPERAWAGGGPLPSRNRVLPATDLKGDGGYVVLPPAPGREWVGRGLPAELPASLAAWWARTRGGRGVGGGAGGGGGHTGGYDFTAFLLGGCPGGMRDEFFNDLLFRLRRAGVDREVAEARARHSWRACAQPPEYRWYMPWEHVAYKLDHVWRTVEPDARAGLVRRQWAEAAVAGPGEAVAVGRVTVAGRAR